MSTLSTLSDDELVARLPALVEAERHAMADVIEHLVEVERRRLYLEHATSSLYRYCIERLGYSEDAALKRHRVARLAARLPEVLTELRTGAIQLTGLFLLSSHLTEDNAAALLGEARGRSRRQIEELLARWFPRPDVASSVAVLGTRVGPFELSVGPVGSSVASMGMTAPPGTGAEVLVAARQATCPGTGGFQERGRLEPLSPGRVRIEFTARAELCEKLDQTRQLLSHALPSGDLGELFERALDALLEKETRRRFGDGRSRKRRALRQGSRHVPVEIERAVWERDGARCTFLDSEGRRCGERHFLTIEHRQPFALGGPATPDNLCLLCKAHNLAGARAVFGEEQIAATIRARCRDAGPGGDGDAAPSGPSDGTPTQCGCPSEVADGVSSRRRGSRTPVTLQASGAHGACSDVPAPEQVASLGVFDGPSGAAPANAALALSALCRLGFPRPAAAAAIGQICGGDPHLGLQQLLRESLQLLVPAGAKAA